MAQQFRFEIYWSLDTDLSCMNPTLVELAELVLARNRITSFKVKLAYHLALYFTLICIGIYFLWYFLLILHHFCKMIQNISVFLLFS